MKFSCNRVLALVVISSAFLLAATSCKKSNNNNNSGSAMSATVGGTSWSSNLGTLGIDVTGGNSGQFDIAGGQLAGGDTTAFELTFLSPFTLNQAVSSDTSQIAVAYSDAKSNQAYEGSFGIGHCILTITAYDSTAKTIGGTFSGVLYNGLNYNDSLVITNGKFNSSYTVN